MNKKMTDTVERFTVTVENYEKYRPSYPSEIVEFMQNECNFSKNVTVADIGSGTGKLSILFLKQGNTVYGVEPNKLMRHTAENLLKFFPLFISVNGTAEATTLNNDSIDVITAGTSFHWFDREKTKQEFRRILKKEGWVFLIWNVRDIEASPFLREYEKILLNYCTDYATTNAKKFDKTAVKEFFYPHTMKTVVFPNQQQFDWDGLKGRLLSTSYSLRPTDINYNAMMDDLQKIFNLYQENGKIYFLYKTKLYFGKIHSLF